jgi:hypothetical protein
MEGPVQINNGIEEEHMKLKYVLLASACLALSAYIAVYQPQLLLPKVKILFIGNSITLHPPAPEIGWSGNYGMAASSEHTDYVHIVSKKLHADYRLLDLGAWERNYSQYDLVELNKYDGWADIVIIKLGENVTDIKPDFNKSFENLLKQVNCKKTIVVSTWWENQRLNESMRSITLANNFQWVELPEHDTTYNAINFQHSGVTAHPGDKGMRLIADSIVTAIKKR